MKVIFETRAIRHYDSLSFEMQKAADKQFRMLRGNIRHPSLHAKKYNESTGE